MENDSFCRIIMVKGDLIMKKNKGLYLGAKILLSGIIVSVIMAIIVVESTIPSSASNDGWLGFLGGLFGSLLSGIVAFYVLHVNRKDTIEIQNEQRQLIELQLKRQLADSLVSMIADYITDISQYFYTYYFNEKKPVEEKKEADRKIAVNRYFNINMRFSGIQEAEDLLKELYIMHLQKCFFEDGGDRTIQKKAFETSVDKLQNKTNCFVKKFVKLKEV